MHYNFGEIRYRRSTFVLFVALIYFIGEFIHNGIPYAGPLVLSFAFASYWHKKLNRNDRRMRRIGEVISTRFTVLGGIGFALTATYYFLLTIYIG